MRETKQQADLLTILERVTEYPEPGGKPGKQKKIDYRGQTSVL
jgi:hypothetical protein